MITENELLEWINLKDSLKELKAREMYLRTSIVKDIMTGVKNPSKTLELFGIELRATKSLNYKVDKALLDSSFLDLTICEQRALKFTPKIKSKEYNALPPDCALKSKIVTITPSAPTLTIVSMES